MARKMTMALASVIVLLAPSFLGGCSIRASTTTATSAFESLSLSYFQTLAGGSYKDGVLSVQEVVPQLLLVAEGSVQLTGYLATGSFVALWQQDTASYQAYPPQATLAIATPGGTKNVALVLSSPALSGGVLSYHAQVTSGELPASFGAANLSIQAIRWPATGHTARLLGDAPAIAMGSLFQATSQALADARNGASGISAY
jgi:hypothetical protein